MAQGSKFYRLHRYAGKLARAWRDDHQGWTAIGMSRWKHPHLRAMFGGAKGITFRNNPPTDGPPLLAWAGRMDEAAKAAGAVRVEDGFLRSRGLGARLVPPLSLVLDRKGIYYDPTAPSDLEDLINASEILPEADRTRAERLIARLTRQRIANTTPAQGRSPKACLRGGASSWWVRSRTMPRSCSARVRFAPTQPFSPRLGPQIPPLLSSTNRIPMWWRG